MKKVVLILISVLVFSCADENPANTQPTILRSINDYRFNADDGMEYRIGIKNSYTDTNGITQIESRDTVLIRTLNLNYNHPVYGFCSQFAFSRSRQDSWRADTVYMQVKDGVLYSIHPKGNNTDYLELLREPLQIGTTINYNGYEMKIIDMDKKVATQAGLFDAIVTMGEKKTITDEISIFTSSIEQYYAKGVVICKSVEKNTLLYKKTNKTRISISESELIEIKKTQ